ncbi:matrix metalloproteinase-19-like [Littorina saxatilis]|uniref:Peptidase metallopeptidase domain-containing protein n=1 Tax=Littorina saxatilis TaxID=31220 RepID=A0AAN9AJG4_9CAEN
MGRYVVVVFVVSVFLTLLSAADNFDAGNFLEKFGYLDDLAPGQAGHSESSTNEAVREFQRFNGLRATGRLNRETIRKMKQPRCGLPDVVKPGQRAAGLTNGNRRGGNRGRNGRRPDQNQPSSFYAPGYKWEKKDLTYAFMGYTRQLGGTQQINAIGNAFQKWADVAPLNFRKVGSGGSDIEISFVRRQHSDGAGNAFDGRGGTLAHAFFPGDVPIAGDTHFDEDEQWTLGSEDGTNLEIVAAHEFGHALGLGHSNVPTALMAPYYQGYDPNFALHRDDISGIQSLYGRGRGSVAGGTSSGGSRTTPRPRVTPRPRPRTTPRPRVTPRPRTTPAPRGRYCNVRFDAFSQHSDGYMYAFRKRNVFKINSRGVMERRRATSVFPSVPISPGAAVYDRYRRQLFIFKGSRYWRYTGNRLDSGYPRTLPRDFQNIRAAFQWSDRGIYLFSRDNKYMRWAEGLTRFSRGYPRPVRDYFQGAPTNIEAALQGQDGYYYLFKGRRYWKYNAQAQLQRGYPKDTRPAWLSCGTARPR